MKLNQLHQRFNLFSKSAGLLIKDKHKTITKVQQGFNKAVQNKGDLGKVWDQLVLLFSLAKDYANGSYTAIPTRAIIAVFAGLLYFISPFDVVPDFIPGLGFIDDAFILGMVYKQIAKDLAHYQKWKKNNKQIISI